MARSFGRIFTQIWRDSDFVALGRDAQRLYMLFLSQSGLSLAGHLDLMVQRWASSSADTTRDDIVVALDELSVAGFVVVDWATEELVVRTLPKHDLEAGRLNRNLLRGLWTSWQAILSATLRQVVVDNMPQSVWDRSGDEIPTEAARMRRSPRLEPEQPGGSRPDTTDRSGPGGPGRLTPGEQDPGDRSGPSPDPDSGVKPRMRRSPRLEPERAARSEPPSPSPSPSPSPPPGERSDNPQRLSTDQRQRLLLQACEILTDRYQARTPSTVNRGGQRAAALRGKFTDHHDAGHRALVADPSLTPDRLADLLEPPPPGPSPAATAATVPDPAATLDRLDEQRRLHPAPPPPDLLAARRSQLAAYRPGTDS